jgi:hypothetical protein
MSRRAGSTTPPTFTGTIGTAIIYPRLAIGSSPTIPQNSFGDLPRIRKTRVDDDDLTSIDPEARIRVEKERAAQTSGPETPCDVLGQAGTPHRLSEDTRIGAARGRDVAPWDRAVEVCFPTGGRRGALRQGCPAVRPRGIRAQRRDAVALTLKPALERNGSVFGLQASYRDGRWRSRSEYRTEQLFLDRAIRIELRGRGYPRVETVEEWFTDCYDDWQTPLRTADKSAYLRPGYFRRSRSIRQARQFARVILRSLRRHRGAR